MARKSPAFSFYPESWWMGTLGLTPIQRAAYIDLLCLQWESGGFTLAFALGSARGIPEDTIRFVLASKFVQDEDGNWYNERLEAERVKQQAYREKQAKNGSLGGRPKSNRNPADNPNKTQRLTQTETQAEPNQKPSVSVSVSDSVSKETSSSVLDLSKKHDQPNPTPSSGKTENRSGRWEKPAAVEDHLPEPLRTPEFQKAWSRWLDYRLACDGRLNPVQQELQLKQCLERGVEKAIRDLDASVMGGSKGQIFDSDRFAKKPKEEPKAAESRSVTWNYTTLKVNERGVALCPFAGKPVELATVDARGKIVSWLVDDEYRQVAEQASQSGPYVFWEAFWQTRPELLSRTALEKMKQKHEPAPKTKRQPA